MTNDAVINGSPAADERTPPTDTRPDASARTGTGTGTDTPSSAQGQRKFEVLSTIFLAGLPEEARRDVYLEVLKRVHSGEIAGLVHRGNFIASPMPLTGVQASRESRPLEEVLLKATSNLTEQLEMAARVVFRRQTVRERGRGLTVSELEEMGDELDFDGMVAQDRKARAAASRPGGSAAQKPSTGAKAKPKPKKNRG